MGLDDEEIVNADSVSQTLRCPICHHVYIDPVFCGGRPCQHVFCRECIQHALRQRSVCPSCRSPMVLSDLQTHQGFSNQLDELMVYCQMKCGWTGRRDARVGHTAVCPVILHAECTSQLAERIRQVEECTAELNLCRDSLSVVRTQFSAVAKRLDEALASNIAKDDQLARMRELLETKEREIKELNEQLSQRLRSEMLEQHREKISDETMHLWHGTNQFISIGDAVHPTRDGFMGPGTYLTSNKTKATAWAVARSQFQGFPMVLQVEVRLGSCKLLDVEGFTDIRKAYTILPHGSLVRDKMGRIEIPIRDSPYKVNSVALQKYLHSWIEEEYDSQYIPALMPNGCENTVFDTDDYDSFLRNAFCDIVPLALLCTRGDEYVIREKRCIVTRSEEVSFDWCRRACQELSGELKNLTQHAEP